MDGKTHLFAGVAAGIGLMAYLKIEYEAIVPLVVVGSALGSLLPDIDSKTSMLGRFLPFYLIFSHRGFTHSLMFIAVTYIIATALHVPYIMIVGMIFGIVTHLILDAMTPMGLPCLLFPYKFKKKKYKYKKRK